MTETASPVTGGPVMEELDWSDLWAASLSNGVIKPLGLALECYTDADGRQVKIRTGTAHVHGKIYRNTATVTLALGTNTSGADRFDRIVVRYNENDSPHTVPNSSTVIDGRKAKLVVLPGTPAAATLSNGAGGIYDVPIATVEVDNAFTTIVVSPNKITDNRLYVQPTYNTTTGRTEQETELAVGTNAVGRAGTGVVIGDFQASEAYIKAIRDTGTCALVLQSKGQGTGTASSIQFQNHLGETAAYFSAASGIVHQDTTMVLGIQVNSNFFLRRVYIGAADSGGSGYRLLRVDN